MSKQGKNNSLMSFMDDETKSKVKELQRGQTVTLSDGRKLGELDVNLIDPDKDNIRQDGDDYDHESLALSIEDIGLHEPITVTEEGERYKILTGEQRWTAWMLLYAKDPDRYAFIPSIIKPAIIVKKEKSVKSVRIKTQVVENFSRFDGTIFDLADAIIELWEVEGKEYAIEALKMTKHATNSTALSRLKNLSTTSADFRERINSAGIEGKGTIETLSKIHKKKPDLFVSTMDKYDADELVKPLDKEATDVWTEISGKKKKKATPVEETELVSNDKSLEQRSNEQVANVDDDMSLESPQASLLAESVSVDGSSLKIRIKNGSELLITLPKGLKLEVSG